MSAPSTLFVASIPFASEYGSTQLCLSRSVAPYILLLGRFGSHSTPADRAAAAVDPPPVFSKKKTTDSSRVLLMKENSIFFIPKMFVLQNIKKDFEEKNVFHLL